MSGMRLLAGRLCSSDCQPTFSTQVPGDSFNYVPQLGHRLNAKLDASSNRYDQ